jgi:nucleoside 2-deoxyribosyltransferase
MKVIYVAGPYRHATREGIELNIQSAKKVGCLVAQLGWSPIVPHMNTAHMDSIIRPGDEKFWLDATLELMRRCDAVVLCAGWQMSRGTIGEIIEAVRLGIPIYESAEVLPCPAVFVPGPRLPKFIDRAIKQEMADA